MPLFEVLRVRRFTGQVFDSREDAGNFAVAMHHVRTIGEIGMERQEQGKEPSGIVVHDMHIIFVAEQTDHRREKFRRPAGGIDHAIHGKAGGHQDKCYDIPDQISGSGQ